MQVKKDCTERTVVSLSIENRIPRRLLLGPGVENPNPPKFVQVFDPGKLLGGQQGQRRPARLFRMKIGHIVPRLQNGWFLLTSRTRFLDLVRLRFGDRNHPPRKDRKPELAIERISKERHGAALEAWPSCNLPQDVAMAVRGAHLEMVIPFATPTAQNGCCCGRASSHLSRVRLARIVNWHMVLPDPQSTDLLP